ncbi:unnamed protein product [Diplocarpon coronariae]
MDGSTITAGSSPTISDHRLSFAPTGPVNSSPVDIKLISNHTADEPELLEAAATAATAMSESVDSGEGGFFNLHPPPSSARDTKIEDVMKRLFSAEHLHFILADSSFFRKFSSFLNQFKPNLVPTLIRYLEMRKAIKAIEYANSVAREIRWPSHTDYYKFSRLKAAAPDVRFEDYAEREMLLLCSEALPAFVTHILVGVVTDCVSRDMAGHGIPILRDLIGNLAEVFCLTDPSVHDNPIIFASEAGEFHRTTQYGTTYAIDRNCRFLQGPGTDKNATLRLTKAISLGQESNEVLLNYRRDGSPFVNLLMCSPLYDDKGIIRYFIGAQVDVTGLVLDGLGIESFHALLHSDDLKKMGATREAGNQNLHSQFSARHPSNNNSKTKDYLARLQELSMMFSQDESDVVNRNSRGAEDSTDGSSVQSGVPNGVKNRGQSKRFIGGNEVGADGNVLNFSHHINKLKQANTNLPGIYKHASQTLLYLPLKLADGSESTSSYSPVNAKSIPLHSPSLRIPGLLRTHLFTKLGGPRQTISALESAFRDGASVTAKVLWLPKDMHAGERGRGPAEVKPRYIRCTPLLGSDDRVGVWMVILVAVDEELVRDGYRLDPMHDIADDLREERKLRGEMNASTGRSMKSSRVGSVRQTPSFDTEADGRFGLENTRGSRKGVLVGRGELQQGSAIMKEHRWVDMDEKQLYAQYMWSSSGIAGDHHAPLLHDVELPILHLRSHGHAILLNPRPQLKFYVRNLPNTPKHIRNASNQTRH